MVALLGVTLLGAATVTAAAAAAAPASLSAELLLQPGVFSDGMVLQREPLAARLFGSAAPRATVRVVLANDAPIDVVADASGRRVAALPPQPASTEPRTVTVTSGGATAVLRDVLFGDVFLCGGQSNSEQLLHPLYISRLPLPSAGLLHLSLFL
jgi:hypothetical protein